MANMKDIAKMAGVSLGTVSNVLNDSARVREPVRKRVLEAVQAVGYQPSRNKSVIPTGADPDFPTSRPLTTATYAAHFKERRTNFTNHTNLDRKYGGAQWRDPLFCKRP
jgi:hypothetical protein